MENSDPKPPMRECQTCSRAQYDKLAQNLQYELHSHTWIRKPVQHLSRLLRSHRVYCETGTNCIAFTELPCAQFWNNHNSRVLRIHLSSEEDLFMLHTLEFNEEEFQALKAEQGILVDFSNFPGKIIGLLERCIASSHEEAPRFQAVLLATDASSVFKIVETNDFNQLPHITLALRPGNDAAIKHFLASRLSEVKLANGKLGSDIKEVQAELEAACTKLQTTEEQLVREREQHQRYVMEREADAKASAAAALHEKTSELAALRDALDRVRVDMEERHRQQVEALQARNCVLEAEAQHLREAKFGLEARSSELGHRLASVEGTLASLEAEAERLREGASAARSEKERREAELSEQRTRLSAAEEKVTAQKEVMAEQSERLRDLEAGMRQLEERCTELKEAAAGHEERARAASAEVLKGNRIIDKLMADLRLARERLRRKAAIVARQEEEVTAKERALETAAVDAQALQHALDQARSDAAKHQAECGELCKKLEESRKQLDSNDQMIRWLNNQVNEAQLHGALSSKYSSYRPALHGVANTYATGVSTRLPLRVQEPPSIPYTYAEQMAKTLPASGSTSPAPTAPPSLSIPSSLPLQCSLPRPGTGSTQAAAAAPAHSCAPVNKHYTGSVQFQSSVGQRLAAGGATRAAFPQPPLASAKC
ncbi:g9553 [Coccomyxa elongata]